MSDPSPDAAILAAWLRNAAPWEAAVREQRIESRRLVTDQAIVAAVKDAAPRRVLDLGCGEGWLARALSAEGIAVTGVDAVPELIEAACRHGGGAFHVVAYEQLAAAVPGAPFDAVVCNFSLLGEQSVEEVFAALPALLVPGGRCIVQTLHPLIACGDGPYRDGWREGSWAGIDGDFTDAPPWYFRTLESWVGLLLRHGLMLEALREPLHPATGRPASVIVVGRIPI
ncbi:MAG TPA: class I SAM-dependent methyltransferase [Dokdonella sp.]|uniref:class I SAM-dependent methyltransferase n=1 Tax=Dokdonella sp. TaxID=2291710 RepID=UPI002B589F77|nr:class I SAM-dependent methyltransferase [Dokdonella sp.]HUD41154.1 class I SAM-dependent methyltransferase [Dokdonella sp.]